MSDEKNSSKRFNTPIESREDALHWIKWASIGFDVLGALYVVKSFVLGLPALACAVVYIVGGGLLFRLKSRVVAVSLLVFVLVVGLIVLINMSGGTIPGFGKNVVTSFISILVAGRGVEATYKLFERFSDSAVKSNGSTS